MEIDKTTLIGIKDIGSKEKKVLANVLDDFFGEYIVLSKDISHSFRDNKVHIGWGNDLYDEELLFHEMSHLICSTEKQMFSSRDWGYTLNPKINSEQLFNSIIKLESKVVSWTWILLNHYNVDISLDVYLDNVSHSLTQSIKEWILDDSLGSSHLIEKLIREEMSLSISRNKNTIEEFKLIWFKKNSIIKERVSEYNNLLETI